MQVNTFQGKFQNFSGINFLNQMLSNTNFYSLVESKLGLRAHNSKYSFADVIAAISFMFSIGGQHIEDIQVLRQDSRWNKDLAIPSPDSVKRVVLELSSGAELRTIDTQNKNSVHTLIEHYKLNELLVGMVLKLKLLNKTTDYCLDADGNHLVNEKPDNATSYKGTDGYYPVVCAINGIPIYLQNRNGNTPEGFKQLEYIKQAHHHCEQIDIRIKRFRGDASYYEASTLDYLEQKEIDYFIRAEKCQNLSDACQDENVWKTARLNYKEVEVCSVYENVLGKERRVVLYREALKRKDPNLWDIKFDYKYQAIVSNNHTLSELEVIEFYNQRAGVGEHHFKYLDNDFGWNKLPYDNILHNTIYMYLTALAYVLFLAFKKQISAVIPMIKYEMNLRSFTLYFVQLVGKWVKKAGTWVLKILDHKAYYLKLLKLNLQEQE